MVSKAMFILASIATAFFLCGIIVTDHVVTSNELFCFTMVMIATGVNAIIGNR
jgi:hypothetical protein